MPEAPVHLPPPASMPPPRLPRTARVALGLAVALVVAACGGGSGDDSNAGAGAGSNPPPAQGGPPAGATADGQPGQGGTPGVDNGTGTTPPPGATPAPDAWSQAALTALNAVRAQARVCDPARPTTLSPAVAPLNWNVALARAAQVHAESMRNTERIDHQGADGSMPGDRLHAQGYAWRLIGEALAAGYPDLDSVIAHWSGSAEHCTVLMDPAFVDVGLARVAGEATSRFDDYWVLDLARPASLPAAVQAFNDASDHALVTLSARD